MQRTKLAYVTQLYNMKEDVSRWRKQVVEAYTLGSHLHQSHLGRFEDWAERACTYMETSTPSISECII